MVVDGDSAGIKQRLKELDQRLEEAGSVKRDTKEKIATCVPSRTVETWELWLCGRHDLNEASDYKADFQMEKRKGRASADRAVKAWFSQLTEVDAKAESDCLPALAAGRSELRRLYDLANKD